MLEVDSPEVHQYERQGSDDLRSSADYIVEAANFGWFVTEDTFLIPVIRNRQPVPVFNGDEHDFEKWAWKLLMFAGSFVVHWLHGRRNCEARCEMR